MPQIFSKKANTLPALTLAGLTLGGILSIGAVWYWFSPEFTDVGYAPEQPVPYSHLQHVGEFGMDCQYCHSYVSESNHSNIPATQTCMNCHTSIRTESLKLLSVRESWATGDPVPWLKVHHLPDYARFDHSAHVNIGVGCESCHGRVDKMAVVSQTEPLSMGWCLDCHRNPGPDIRPADVSVTQMDWEPDEEHSLTVTPLGREVDPPLHCSGCHR